MRPTGLLLVIAAGMVHGCQYDDSAVISKQGPWTGDLTFNDVGLGACGIQSTRSDLVAAVSHVLFDAAATSGNPNENPLCRASLRIYYGGKHVDVRVVDRCIGCKKADIDVSSGVFEKLASLDQGRVTVSWQWNERSGETQTAISP